jgi:sarcosine oxidase subunit beta
MNYKMKNKYSIFSLIKNSFSYHKNWQRAWRDPEPKSNYDVVIVGGGGHGLSTAYYLAKEHNFTNIAVVEKGWIGGGNTGRNTTIIRSNYLCDASTKLYDHALKIWENLSNELNFNVMFSQRGVMNLAHNQHDVRELKRRTHANRLNGIDCEWLDTKQINEFCPIINCSPNIRYPVMGSTLQRRAGTARHDAVAWGYARGADSMGVDIIQNCEVKGIKRKGNIIEGLETTRGFIKTSKIGVAAAGHSSVIANMAGLKLPLESKPLQALVSEPIKPIINTVVMSNAVHAYVSQSDKGELVIGAGTDSYVSYTQKGTHEIIEGTLNAILELYPIFSRLRMLRQWGGVVDICPDASPIISKTSIKGLYFNCGWGTGGFKAIPGSGHLFAHTIAKDEPHFLNSAFNINRFVSGDLVDEHGAAAVAH